MENTGKIMFEGDEAPQWFLAVGDQGLGPLTASDVYEKILAGEITWAHFVWRAGQAEWKRICDVETFQAAVPTLPPRAVQMKAQDAVATEPPQASVSDGPTQLTVRRAQAGRGATPPPPASTTVVEERVWFLHYNDSQFGPFSQEEILRFLRIGKIHGRVYSWRDGMATWERLERIEGFEDAVQESKRVRGGVKTPPLPGPGGRDATPPKPPTFDQDEHPALGEKTASKAASISEDQRKAPRRPLVAKILLASESEESVSAGVCRDISVGGMQVLTDKVPGAVGARIKLNVSPSGPKSKIGPFVAGGVIVRILEDGRGFSFRFDRLSAEAKRSIEEYISTAAG